MSGTGKRRRAAGAVAGVTVALAVAVVSIIAAGCDGGDGTNIVGPPERSTPASPSAEETPAEDTRPPEPTGFPEIALEEAWSGFDQPLQVTNAGDGSGRLFVVEKTGGIRVIRGGEVLDTPFLDLTGSVSGGSEQGLLCLEFSPDHGSNGRFYVNYTDREGDTVISRFRVSEDPDRADRDSEEVLLRIEQPYPNHNGGQLLFDRAGMLLIGTGDGGAAGDPESRAQDRTVLLGKLLRIDVGEAQAEDSLPLPDSPYRIPSDNPYARHESFRPEIWDYGLRNPWRFSLDPETGALYIGDVGQDAWEEIDVEPPGSEGGLNYGWDLWEGNHPYPPGSDPPEDRDRFTFPVVEYGHDLGQSVTGGVVYRGIRYPRLRGAYLYADFISGRVWGLRSALQDPRVEELLDTDARISSFGYDEDHEVYAADLRGSILRVVAR